MLKWNKSANLTFDLKQNSDSQRSLFSPKHLRITIITCPSSQLQKLPLPIGNCHFSPRPNCLSPKHVAPPHCFSIFYLPLPLHSSHCCQSELFDMSVEGQQILLVVSQHHSSVSFQTEPGFYSSIHNSLLCASRKVSLPSSPWVGLTGLRVSPSALAVTGLVLVDISILGTDM